MFGKINFSRGKVSSVEQFELESVGIERFTFPKYRLVYTCEVIKKYAGCNLCFGSD